MSLVVGAADVGARRASILRRSASEPQLFVAIDNDFSSALLGLQGTGSKQRRSSQARAAPRSRSKGGVLDSLAQAVGYSSAKPSTHNHPCETAQSRFMRRSLRSAGARIVANAAQALEEESSPAPSPVDSDCDSDHTPSPTNSCVPDKHAWRKVTHIRVPRHLSKVLMASIEPSSPMMDDLATGSHRSLSLPGRSVTL
jgi:hypothetical protein